MHMHIQYRYRPCATQSEGEYRGKGRVVYPSRGCRIQHYWHTTNRPALPARYFAASRALLCPVPYIYIGVHPFAKLNLSTASISAQLSTLLYVDTPTEGSPYIQYFEYIRYAGVNTATPPQSVVIQTHEAYAYAYKAKYVFEYPPLYFDGIGIHRDSESGLKMADFPTFSSMAVTHCVYSVGNGYSTDTLEV